MEIDGNRWIDNKYLDFVLINKKSISVVVFLFLEVLFNILDFCLSLYKYHFQLPSPLLYFQLCLLIFLHLLSHASLLLL